MTNDEAHVKHSRSAFVFTPELGARLRALRRQRGLTMKELAALMGRDSPGAFNHLAKLEQGKLRHPSLNLLIDYLRACRVGPLEAASLFEPYLSLPPVPRARADAAVVRLLEVLPPPEQRRQLAWDKGVTRLKEERAATAPGRKKPRVETDQERVFRIVWSFVHANWSEVLEQKLYEALLKLKGDMPRSRRKLACDLARRYFGVLTRYYSNQARRKNALERIERRAAEEGFSEEAAGALLDAATQSYNQLLISGRLDWEPTQEEIIKRRGQAPNVLKAETRLEMDEARPVSEENKARNLVRVMVQMAVEAKLEEQQLDFFLVKRHYHTMVDRLVEIGFKHGTNSPEWQAEVDATTPRLHDETFARSMAVLAAKVFERWRAKSPTKSPAIGH